MEKKEIKVTIRLALVTERCRPLPQVGRVCIIDLLRNTVVRGPTRSQSIVPLRLLLLLPLLLLLLFVCFFIVCVGANLDLSIVLSLFALFIHFHTK